MNAAPILALRRAIVSRLKADDIVTALLPAASIYGERVLSDATWPFIRYGQSDAVDDRITVPVHVFSKSEFTDEAAGIAEAIGSSLDGAVLTLGGGERANLAARFARIIPDAAEQSAWHAMVTVTATVAPDCDGR